MQQVNEQYANGINHINSTYRRDPSGNMVETNASIKRQISTYFGFQQSRIVLCEASYSSLYFDGCVHVYCTVVSFRVNGIGYTADLFYQSLSMNEAYNSAA